MKARVLAVGYYAPGTGFTRVLDSIFSRLSSDYEIHLIGISYKGSVIYGDYTVYPNNLTGGDMYGAYQCQELAEDLNPEIIFLLNDFWMLKNYNLPLAEYRNRGGKVIAYAPLDGYIKDESILYDIDFLSHLVVYNQFAKDQVLQGINRIKSSNPNYNFPDLSVIGHGVDLSAFHPINKIEAKKQFFPELSDLEDSFIVLNANRYDSRKRIDLTIEAFAHFAQSKPSNVILYLHHAIASIDQREEILELSEKFGCKERVYLNDQTNNKTYLTDSELNTLYNACDVGINSSMGEGWGMISFEHAATQTPQVMPHDPAGYELWGPHAILISSAKKYTPPFTPFEMVELDPIEMANTLNALYTSQGLWQTQSELALEHSRKSVFSWDVVSKEWKSLFEKIKLQELNSKQLFNI